MVRAAGFVSFVRAEHNLYEHSAFFRMEGVTLAMPTSTSGIVPEGVSCSCSEHDGWERECFEQDQMLSGQACCQLG